MSNNENAARTRSSRVRVYLGVMLLSGWSAFFTAHAATPSDTPDPAALEEIIVTAQKKDELLSNTPLAITALTGTQLQALGVKNFADFATYVPGITYASSGAGQTQVNLRGITNGPAVTPTVGIYVDDVPYGGTSVFSRSALLALDAAVVDLDRIEVLRGPQGTLYGASTMGGLIKYVTNKPDPTNLSGYVSADLSDTSNGGANYDLQGAINLPLATDTAAVRASGYYLHDAGYIDNVARADEDANRAGTYGGRLDFLLNPTEQLSVRLTGFAQDIHRDGRAEVDKTFGHLPLFGTLDQSRVVAEPFDQSFRLVSATLEYAFTGAKLTSISSYQSVRTAQVQDGTPLLGPELAGFGLVFPQYAVVIDTNTKKFTQETRLASSGGGSLDWLVGGFYTHEHSDNDQGITPRDATGSPAPLNLLRGQFPNTYEETAGFGDLTYHFTPRFDLTFGARLAHNQQTFEQIGSGLLLSSLPEGRSGETVKTYLFNPRFQASDHLMLYARAASGYRPGGPNAVVTDVATGKPLANPTFVADRLWSYEGGVKASTADHRFAVDAAVFFVNWSDLQVAAARNGLAVVANAGKARSQGAELTLDFRPIDELNFMAVVAYTDAKLTQNAPDLGGVDGERLPDVPRMSAALTGDYHMPLGNTFTGTFGGSVRYVGSRSSSFDASVGSPQYQLADYTTVDLRAGLEFGRLAAQLYARNVFDEHGELSAFTAFSAAGGPAQVAVQPPRTIGVNLTARF